MKRRAGDEEGASGLWSWLRSLVIFVSYYLYFTFADLSGALRKHESLLSPHLTAYAIWLAIYAVQFAFVCYQLFNKSARLSKLVNKKLVLPYLLHQLLFAAWLRAYQGELILAAAGIYSALWLMTFVCYFLITSEFRNGEFDGYKLQSWLMIEVPFALTLGWETFSMLVNWSSAVVSLANTTGYVPRAAELAAFICSLLLIVQAAVLFAGLSVLMNPFLHLGLVWGCACTAYRLVEAEIPNFETQRLALVPLAAGIAAAFTSALSFIYLCVSLCIMCQSQFCLPDLEEDHIPGPNFASTHVCKPPPSAPAQIQCAIPVLARGGPSARRLNNISLPAPSTRNVT